MSRTTSRNIVIEQKAMVFMSFGVQLNLNLQTSILGLGQISIKASHKIVAKLIPTPKLLEKGGAKMGS
jgi:hypothetical protein